MDNKLGIGSKLEHQKFGLGVVVAVDGDYYKIYFSSLDEVKAMDRSYDGFTVHDKVEAAVPAIELSEIEDVVTRVFEKYAEKTAVIALGNKWIGGTVTITPGSTDMQAKEIPIQTFFHKVVMVRDRLRVLEQNINSHEKLDDEDKVHLQQYITRAYGSLTTFNVLFSDKSNQFKGAGS